IRMLLQEVDISLQRALLVGANVRLVVVEVNVLYVPGEQFLVGRDRRRWWRRRRRQRSHGNLRRSRLRPAGSFGRQSVGGGTVGRDRLRSTCLNSPDGIDADVGGIRRLPTES